MRSFPKTIAANYRGGVWKGDTPPPGQSGEDIERHALEERPKTVRDNRTYVDDDILDDVDVNGPDFVTFNSAPNNFSGVSMLSRKSVKGLLARQPNALTRSANPTTRQGLPDAVYEWARHPPPLQDGVIRVRKPSQFPIYESGQRELLVLAGVVAPVPNEVYTCVAFSRDSTLIALGSNRKLYVREFPSLALVNTYYQNTNIVGVAFSPDNVLIYGGGGNTVRAWNVQTGENVKVYTGMRAVTCIAVSPDGKLVAAGYVSGNPNIKVWDTETENVVCYIQESVPHPVHSITFSMDSKSLGAASKHAQVYDVTTGEEVWAYRRLRDAKGMLDFAFSGDGKQYLFNTSKRRLVYDTETSAIDEHPKTTPYNSSPSYLNGAFSKSGSWVFHAERDHISLWNPRTNSLKRFFTWAPYGGGAIWSISVSHDDAWVASVQERTVYIWQTNGIRLAQTQQHAGGRRRAKR